MASVFNGAFSGLLTQTIESDTLPAFMGSVLELGPDQDERRMLPRSLLRKLEKFNRLALTLMCDFSRIELSPEPSTTQNRKQNRTSSNWSKLGAARPKWWARLVFAVFVSASVTLIANTYFQYIYDVNSLKLRKLADHLKEVRSGQWPDRNLANLTQFELELGRRATAARRVLKLLGAHRLQWSFLVESVVLIFLPSATGCFVLYPMWHRLKRWTILAALSLVDPRKETSLRTELTLDELNKFARDSRTFALARLEQIGADLAELLHRAGLAINQPERLRLLRRRTMSRVARVLRAQHQTVVEQLARIALEGRLNPLNRTRACRDRHAVCFALGLSFMLLYMQSTLVVGYCSTWRHLAANEVQVELASFRDALDAFNWPFVVEQSANSALVIMSLMAIMIYDQFESTARLHKLTLFLAKENNCKLRQLATITRAGPFSPTEPAAAALSRDIQLNLLTIIVQHRLAARTFGLIRGPLSLIASLLIYFSVACPIVFKLHSAYFDSQLRTVSSRVGLLSSGCCLVFLYTLGLLHQKQVALLKPRWTLAAQLSQFDVGPETDRSWDLLTSLVACTFRRELSDTRQTSAKFACRIWAMPTTNTNIIRLAIYTLLIFIPLSSDVSVNVFGDGLAKLLGDPFGVSAFISR